MSAPAHAPQVGSGTVVAARPANPGRADAPRPQYIQLKSNVHKKLLNRLNLEALATSIGSAPRAEIRTLVFELMAEEATPVSMAEREQILSDILDEVFGLGPLEPLLRDPNINDILVNTFKQVYIERAGVLTRVPTTFQDDRHLLRVIDRIVSASAGAWTTARRWSTRASRTARASTRSFRRSLSTVRCSRSGASRRSG